MSITMNKTQTVKSVSDEVAYELASEIAGADRTDVATGSLHIISGTHQTLGPIHIVVPPLGKAAILPMGPSFSPLAIQTLFK